MALTAQRAKTAPTRRSLRDCSPRLPELEAARERMSAAYSDALARQAELIKRITAVANGRQMDASALRVLLDAHAAPAKPDLLAKFGIGSQEPFAPPEPNLLDQLSAVKAELAGLTEALPKLDEEIANERVRASAVLLDDLRPEHDAMVKRMIDAVLELQEAHRDYFDRTNAWKSEGISWAALGPMGLDFADEPRDPQGSVAFWLRRAAKLGHFDRSRLPAELVYKPRAVK